MPTDHLRFSGATEQAQRDALEAIVRNSALLMDVLGGMRDLALPDMLLGSGAIYNTVWNVLTGRPSLTGIKDADVVYFDDSDLSYEAEDAVIRRAAAQFAGLPVPVELRNQARVHIWFPQKFGTPYPQLKSSAEMMLYFASRTHAVAVRLEEDGRLSIFAPFGLDDIFSFRITPNPTLDNAATHATKAARAKAVWPELTVIPWPEGAPASP
ncbi:nucleotidyltransferase family protein [Devosia ginsengisoli]|uniref:Nucleotidyltransferase family protein n=1 Tax=Devosia ginsengisoli TaxID=400770 RepID=A0A5B8LV04_9HYPH|nr:nucleotidyltransferase family protein [Devosia ginsengisoli]QDZ11669.1 nucleotidyltransferase family protein [Devosia ginsengisoli]